MSHPCYADDISVLGGSVYVVNNTEAVVVAGKETGLEMNADNIKYRTWSYLEIRALDEVKSQYKH
jgi:hypothetical protein